MEHLHEESVIPSSRSWLQCIGVFGGDFLSKLSILFPVGSYTPSPNQLELLRKSLSTWMTK